MHHVHRHPFMGKGAVGFGDGGLNQTQELVVPVRQHEQQAIFPAPGQVRRGKIAHEPDVANGPVDPLDGHGAHTGPPVEYAIHSGQTDTGSARQILCCGFAHLVLRPGTRVIGRMRCVNHLCLITTCGRHTARAATPAAGLSLQLMKKAAAGRHILPASGAPSPFRPCRRYRRHDRSGSGSSPAGSVPFQEQRDFPSRRWTGWCLRPKR